MTKVKSIPSIEKGMLANRAQERDHTKAMNGLRKIKLSKIVVREGFNLRETFDEIEILASIRSYEEEIRRGAGHCKHQEYVRI